MMGIEKYFAFAKWSMVLAAVNFSARADAGIVGLWEFNDSANIGKATLGTDLLISGTAPAWSASRTYGGNTLNGVIDTVVGVPNNLVATHGIAPNGGGANVNQYSMLFDIRRPDSAEWRTLFQTNTANINDGDYFVRDSDGQLGVGALGYTTYSMPANTWIRLVITSDLATGDYRTYVDGVLQLAHTATPVDGRHSFSPTVLLFGDEDGENGLLSVGAVAIWDQSLAASQVTTLGIAGGAIVAVPEPSSCIMAGVIGVGFVASRLRRRKTSRLA